MGLKRKLNLLTLGFTVVIIIVLSYVLFLYSSQKIFQLEERLFVDEMTTVKNRIEKEFSDLDYILKDWAQWEVTYAYVQGQRDDYVEENVGDDALTGLSIDYIYFFDENDEPLYSLMADPSDNRVPIEQPLLDLFKTYKGETGLLEYDGKTILFASMEISDNEGAAPPKGFMGFARIVDKDYLDEISEELSLTIVSNSGEFSPTSDAPQIQGDYNVAIALDHSNETESNFYITIPLFNSSNELIVKTIHPNDIQSLGESFINSVLIMVIVILGSFGILLNFAFSHIVLNRLLELNEQIAYIRKMKNTKKRIGRHGYDEIGELGENINLMLEELDVIHSEITRYATYDEMTGVYNRRAGLDILENAIDDANAYLTPLSVIFIDLDGLKKINDSFGHAVGDEMITSAIEIVTEILPKPKIIIRLGGDEFLVILKNHTLEQAKVFEAAITESVDHFNKASSHVYTLGLSMGTVSYEKGMALDDYIENADKAMYAVKVSKANRRQ